MACTPRLRLAERTVRLASTLLAACVMWAALPSSAATASGPAVKAVATATAWQGVWEGRLAGQPIVRALYLNEQGRWTGRYFYERFGRDLGRIGMNTAATRGFSADEQAVIARWLEHMIDLKEDRP